VAVTGQQTGSKECQQATHQNTHTRKMTSAGPQHGRAETDPVRQPTGDRNAREKLQAQQIVANELKQE